MVLALQGGMAAGKTTAANWVAKHTQQVHVSLEDNSYALNALQGKKLNKQTLEGYCEIQRIFIEQEIQRYHKALEYPNALLDLGAQEIEFYTLLYPKTIGKNWPIEQLLAQELAQLRKCCAQRTLFLQASVAALQAHKNADSQRDRGFFAHSTAHLLPLKEAWFKTQPNVTFLPTDGFTIPQLGQCTLDWVLANIS